MKREIERFNAVSDDGSYETTLIIYQDYIDAGTRGNPNAVVSGLMEVLTIDGLTCIHVDDDTFEVVNEQLRPQLIVRRIR